MRPLLSLFLFTLSWVSAQALETNTMAEQTMVCSETPLEEIEVSQINKVCVISSVTGFSAHPTYFAFVRLKTEPITTMTFPLHLTPIGIQFFSEVGLTQEVFSMHAYTVVGSRVGYLRMIYDNPADQRSGRPPAKIEGITPVGQKFSMGEIFAGFLPPQ